MTGFRVVSRPVATLRAGERVQWGIGSSRVVESVRPVGDGSDHLVVVYAKADRHTPTPCSRYAAGARVSVLEIVAYAPEALS